MAEPKVPLSQVLDVINAEIRQAHANATKAGHTAVRRFLGCELEFAIDIEAKADGGFQIWVMKLSGEVKRTESNTIKIRYESHGDWVGSAEAAGGTLGEAYERIGSPESPSS